MNALVVGSSIIDFFIHLKNPDSVKITEETVNLTLGDKIPVDIDKLTLGGNGSNVSVGLTRLGIPTSFYTYVGSDILSQEVERTLKSEGVTLLSEKGEHENTSLSLIFNFTKDRIIFSHHQMRIHTFEYKETLIPDIIYLTSIGKEWTGAYKDVLDFATKNSTPIAFSPGSHQIHDMNDVFMDTLKQSEMIFINKTEAELILKKLNKKTESIEDLLNGLSEAGPSIVSVTDGHNGSYCMDSEKNKYSAPAFTKTSEMTEKTGAGDSYASAFLAEYLLNHSIPDAMRWGALNALSVMKHIGAQEGLLHTAEMKQALADHSDFKVDIMK